LQQDCNNIAARLRQHCSKIAIKTMKLDNRYHFLSITIIIYHYYSSKIIEYIELHDPILAILIYLDFAFQKLIKNSENVTFLYVFNS